MKSDISLPSLLSLSLQSQNREYFAQFLTEDIAGYISRKRKKNVHGNHIEIQAMSEIYNRPVELYCYQSSKSEDFVIILRFSY